MAMSEQRTPTIDGSEFIVRKARKPWVCHHCGAEIEKGESHLEYMGETPAYQSGHRYCWGCAESEWGFDSAYFHNAHRDAW